QGEYSEGQARSYQQRERPRLGDRRISELLHAQINLETDGSIARHTHRRPVPEGVSEFETVNNLVCIRVVFRTIEQVRSLPFRNVRIDISPALKSQRHGHSDRFAGRAKDRNLEDVGECRRIGGGGVLGLTGSVLQGEGEPYERPALREGGLDTAVDGPGRVF